MNKTEVLNANNHEAISRAIDLLKEGELVAIPTETVYGLAADARNINAVKKIFTAKNRPDNHPLIVHISSFEKLSEWAKDIPSIANIIAGHFWPGPLTLLLNKNDSVSDIVTGGLKTIAVRVPQHPVFLNILNKLNSGLAAPSANPHKRISPTKAEHVIDGLSGKIAAVLDGGQSNIGIESTILDLTQPTPKILRRGPVTKKMIENILGYEIDAPIQHTTSVSGNMKSHYQPNTKTLLMPKNDILQYINLNENSHKKFAIVHYSNIEITKSNNILEKMPNCKSNYAKLMYDILHKVDKLDIHEILVEMPPTDWDDCLDRLYRASHL